MRRSERAGLARYSVDLRSERLREPGCAEVRRNDAAAAMV
jgi:hypothetical protein